MNVAYAPGAAAPAFGHAQLTTGVRLRYVEQGDTAGPAVILLHGITDSWISFSLVLPLLPPSWHVYALDLRGHGGSDRPPAGYGMRDLAADVIAFMQARGVRGATLVGHSMGSFVAQQVALVAPLLVSRLVLVGSAPTSRNDVVRELQQVVDTLPDPVPEQFAREFQAGTVHRPVDGAFMDEAVAASRSVPARVWRAAMDGMMAADAATGLGDRRIPTLVLWGDRDAIFGRAEQDALIAMIGTAVLAVYPETGHAPHWERPHDVVRDLVSFVAPVELPATASARGIA